MSSDERVHRLVGHVAQLLSACDDIGQAVFVILAFPVGIIDLLTLRDGTLSVGFPISGGPIPLLRPKKCGLSEQAIHALGILAGPEGHHGAQGGIGFGGGEVVRGIAVPQCPEVFSVFRMSGFLKE